MGEEEVPVKRPRGNPNFVKKPVPENERIVVTTNNLSAPVASPITQEATVWAQFYCSILGTYNAPGSGAVLAAGAIAADMALEEYKKRFVHDVDPD